MSERERRRCLDVLGLPHSSSEDDIRKAYKKLALQYHPDKNSEDSAKERFQEISYAYKYLIEGASNNDSEDDGIPIEVLIRLFPWMFGGAFHPGFAGFHRGFPPRFHCHEYYDPYDDMYMGSDDEDDDDSDDNYYFYKPDQPKSTYTPGPTKEEKKRERKKKARERRKAAKQAKSHTAQGGEAKEAPASYSDDIHMPNKTETVSESESKKVEHGESKAPGTESKGAETKEDKSKNSSKPTPKPPQASQKKKSNKQLRKEQKARQKEIDAIGKEFQKQQQEKAEKEAQRQAARQERLEREATEKAEAENVDTMSNGGESTTTDKFHDEDEEMSKADIEDIDEDDCIVEEESVESQNGDEVVHQRKRNKKKKHVYEYVEVEQDDVDDEDDEDEIVYTSPISNGLSNNRFAPLKKAPSKGKNAKKSATKNTGQDTARKATKDTGQDTAKKATKNIGQDTVRKVTTCEAKPKQTNHGSRTFVNTKWQDQQAQRPQGHGDTFTSRRVETKHTGRQDFTKAKNAGSREEVERVEDDSGLADTRPFEKLQPQTEAEEMKMFHEAIMRSRLQDAVPQTADEEQMMLEAALKESQLAAQWQGNMDTLDDVSDGEDCSLSSQACGGAAAPSPRDWHASIGKNTADIRQDKENVQPGFKLGGLGAGNRGYVNPVHPEDRKVDKMKEKTNGSTGGKFNPAVGTKVKKASAWEFGGSSMHKSSMKSETENGIQFGIDDLDDLDDIDCGGINGYSGVSIGAQQGGGGGKQGSFLSETSLPQQVPKPSWATMCDMDDIDDVDTLGDTSSSYSCSAQPASTFNLNIPKSVFNKEKMKSYYQRKK